MNNNIEFNSPKYYFNDQRYSNYVYDESYISTTECEVSSGNTFGVSISFKSVSGFSHSGISSNGRADELGIGEGLKLDLTVD